MSYPVVPAALAASPTGRGLVLAQGAGVAIAGACAVGVFSGMTRVQSAYVAILASWLVGRTIHRGSSDVPEAACAAIMALVGAAATSLIAVSIRISVTAYVPFEIVAAHVAKVIPLVPRFIGPFGFCCWALAAPVGWWTVRSRSPRRFSSTRAGAAALTEGRSLPPGPGVAPSPPAAVTMDDR